MSLSCSCDYDWEAGSKMYMPVHLDFKPFIAIRRKRCCSCGNLIEHRTPCLEHPLRRYPNSDIEARFNGFCDLEDAFCNEPDIKCASDFHCERCGEIYLNLQALGYECLAPSENMEEALKEYHELSGFKPTTESI
jgi:hypothetical protein